MSKGQHGNKEAKKPKQVPAPKPPAGELLLPLAPATGRSAPHKR